MANNNPNLEWKKSGFDAKEKLTLKVNLKEALKYEAKKKTNVQKNTVPTPADLPLGLKKIRKKIKDVFDEDEDENEDDFAIVSPLSLDENNSLLKALNDDERKILKQQEVNNTIKMQQNAGKMEALSIADRFAKDAGLKKLSKESIANGMQEIGLGENAIKNIVKDDIAKKMNIKGRNLSDAKTIQLLRGIKRIRAVGGADAVKGLKISEVVLVGEIDEKDWKVDDRKVAKIIQKKRGLSKEDPKQRKKTAGKKKMKVNAPVLTQKKSLTYDLLNYRNQENFSSKDL